MDQRKTKWQQQKKTCKALFFFVTGSLYTYCFLAVFYVLNYMKSFAMKIHEYLFNLFKKSRLVKVSIPPTVVFFKTIGVVRRSFLCPSCLRAVPSGCFLAAFPS